MRYQFVLLGLLLLGASAFALIDPSIAYCQKMGYKYKILKISGGESGVCVVNGTSYDAWGFFTGKVGRDYSYCAKKGYDTTTETSTDGISTFEYAVCVPKQQTTVSSAVRTLSSTTSTNKKVPMLTLMQSNADNPIVSVAIKKISGAVKGTTTSLFAPQLPSSFDWRNVNQSNWMTPVKDQAFCGSCWAFAAVGVVEAKLNIDTNNPKAQYDLSEQQLVSCSGAGSCKGGLSDNALNYVKSTGLVSESCFPYTSKDMSCNLCSGWANRTAKIANLVVPIGVTPASASDIKEALMKYGPLVVYLDSSKLYANAAAGNVTGIDHAVVLVGWNDAGGYWIIKNSWGAGWGNDGYGKVKYGEIEKYGYIYAVDKAIPSPYDAPELGQLGIALVLCGSLFLIIWRSRQT